MHQVFKIPALSYFPFMTLQHNYEAFKETSVVKRGPYFCRPHPIGDGSGMGKNFRQILEIFWERDKFNFYSLIPQNPRFESWELQFDCLWLEGFTFCKEISDGSFLEKST